MRGHHIVKPLKSSVIPELHLRDPGHKIGGQKYSRGYTKQNRKIKIYPTNPTNRNAKGN
jgi:hypothetical protein